MVRWLRPSCILVGNVLRMSWRADSQLFTTFRENTKIGWLWLLYIGPTTFVVATQIYLALFNSVQFSSVQGHHCGIVGTT